MAKIIENRSSGTWWKCLLSFLGGIIFTILLVVGGGAIAGTMVPTGTLLGPYASYLSEEFQQMTVTDIVMGVVGGDIKFDNLNDINRITPEIAKLFEGINDSFANAGLNVCIEFDDIKDEPWSSLDTKIIDTFKNGITLADVLGVNESSANILKYFSYPKSGDTYDYTSPYTLAEFMDNENFFGDLIDTLTIGDVVDPDPDNLLLQAIKDFTLSDLQDRDRIYSIELSTLFTEDQKNSNPLLKTISDKGWTIDSLTDGNNIKALKIGEIMEPTAGSLLDHISEKTIGDLDSEDAFDDLLVGDLITIDSNSSPILQYLENKTIGELKTEDLISGMYLDDVFSQDDIDASQILTALNNLPRDPADPSAGTGCKVSEIGNRVNELRLQDVMDCSGDNKIINALKGETIDNLPNALDDLKVSDVFEYYTDPVTGKYYTDNTMTTPMSPVLCKLIGGEPINHPYPGYQATGSTITINRTIDGQEYCYIVFNDGTDENKTDFYKIDDFVDKTTVDISYDSVAQKWVATGSGHSDRDIYSDSFTLTANFPGAWANHYYCISNKTSKISELSAAVDDLKLKDVIQIEPGSVFDNNRIKNTSVQSADELFDVIKEELTLADVIEIDSNSSKILQTLADTKLGEIGSKVDTLLIKDVVDYYKDPVTGIYYTDSNKTDLLPQIMVTFIEDEVSVNGISDAIGDLTIGQVLTEDQRDNRFLRALSPDTPVTGIGAAINDLPFVSVFEPEIFNTEAESTDPQKNCLQSTWKYLLIESDETMIVGNPNKSTDPLDGYKCMDYTVGSGLSQMVNNMKTNMTRATLQELNDDGIMTIDSGFLSRQIQSFLLPYAHGKTYYGELTIIELTDMITHLPNNF